MLLVFSCLPQHIDTNCYEYFFSLSFISSLCVMNSSFNFQEQEVEVSSVAEMLKDHLKLIWDHFLCCEHFLTWNSKKGGKKIKTEGTPSGKGRFEYFWYVYGVFACILWQFQGNGHWFRIVVFSIRWYVILYWSENY